MTSNDVRWRYCHGSGKAREEKNGVYSCQVVIKVDPAGARTNTSEITFSSLIFPVFCGFSKTTFLRWSPPLYSSNWNIREATFTRLTENQGMQWVALLMLVDVLNRSATWPSKTVRHKSFNFKLVDIGKVRRWISFPINSLSLVNHLNWNLKSASNCEIGHFRFSLFKLFGFIWAELCNFRFLGHIIKVHYQMFGRRSTVEVIILRDTEQNWRKSAARFLVARKLPGKQ